MIAIVCIDENNGMMFNHRRQSKDRILIEHIVNLVGSGKLWMGAYSEELFKESHLGQIAVDADYLEKAGRGEFCFIEERDIGGYVDKIEKLIIFKWNRHYPADAFLTIDENVWILEESEEFAGYSHDKITKEIYKK